MWTETLKYWRLKLPKSQSELHGLAPQQVTAYAQFLLLIPMFFFVASSQTLLTIVSTAPVLLASQCVIRGSWFTCLVFGLMGLLLIKIGDLSRRCNGAYLGNRPKRRKLQRVVRQGCKMCLGTTRAFQFCTSEP